MKINKKLLPIKLHYFLFMAALGPILPQLQLLGKDLGVSSVVMGTVTGILPLTFLIVKPLFGLLIDIHRQCRKTIFLFLIFIMTACYGAIYFVPARQIITFNSEYTFLEICGNNTISVSCNSSCFTKPEVFLAGSRNHKYKLCSPSATQFPKNSKCFLACTNDLGLYETFTFWSFIMFMSVGTMGFNVINSISDAICFDIVDDQSHYGEQRLWGSVGFGVAGVISGYLVDKFSTNSSNYAPAFITMAVFAALDVLVCLKVKLPIIEAPKNIFRDLKILLSNRHVVTFITFTVLAGMLDGLIIYFLFWYLEDLALQTNTENVKLIEGLTLAAGTLGAEVIFFSVSGKILKRLGHVYTFTLCFFMYAVRLELIAVARSPWWMVPLEFLMQGPTFALTYTAIVAYANELAPPGLSATMQGIAAGMGDGTGYAIGSVLGGLCYRFFGGKTTFHIFAGVAAFCGCMHWILHKTVLKFEMRDSYEEIH